MFVGCMVYGVLPSSFSWLMAPFPSEQGRARGGRRTWLGPSSAQTCASTPGSKEPVWPAWGSIKSLGRRGTCVSPW